MRHFMVMALNTICFCQDRLGTNTGKVFQTWPAASILQGYNQKNAQDYRCLSSTGGRELNAYCGDGCMWDVFADAAGEMMMDNLVKHFYKESGVKWWWLDCDEPCDYTGRVSSGDALLWGKGEWPDVAVGAAYPMMLNKAIYKHMHDVEKEEHVVTLARSAWAGSQRWVRKRVFLRHLYIKAIILPRQARGKHSENSKKDAFLQGTAVWSGDTSSTWESYRLQISEGQQASLSGISYWSSDTVRKRAFALDCPYKRQRLIICQDRLGTNIIR
jgi:hypothetical protein